jgi:hypothetical protein
LKEARAEIIHFIQAFDSAFLAREHYYFIAQLPDAATICPASQNLEALAQVCSHTLEAA